jgi:hypothetical protein
MARNVLDAMSVGNVPDKRVCGAVVRVANQHSRGIIELQSDLASLCPMIFRE